MTTFIEVTKDAVNTLGSQKYTIGGATKTINSCTYDGTTYTVGDIIATWDNSSNGILKSMLDCTAWANLKIDHYLTTTGIVSGCGIFIPSELASNTCLEAVGISIEPILS